MKLGNKAILLVIVFNIEIEPFVELFRVCKDIWNQEIQQRPKLVQGILKRRSSIWNRLWLVSKGYHLRSMHNQTVAVEESLPC